MLAVNRFWVVPTVVIVAAALASCSGGSKPAATDTTASTTVASTTTEARATRPLAPRSGAYEYRLAQGGRTRDYRLHVPPAARAGSALPLVLNLHGATQNAQLEELQTGMDASSDRDGYLVAYPDGTRIAKSLSPDPVAGNAQYGFDAGACCGDPSTNHLDDVHFLLAVIDDVAARTPVDLRRVYVTGMSNGGMMAYAMAAEASTRIAAIASVAGQLELATIHPTRPVPTLEFHSVDDPVARFDGLQGAQPPDRYSVMDGIHAWLHADGCNSTPRVGTPVVGSGASAGLGATLVTYSGCRGGSEVALWKLRGSGHVWPGAPFNTGPRNTWILDGVGRGTTLLDANEVMWRFFEHFALPATP
jgi:polyhydroxybutyrate depolymerase